jgi:peptidoglycan/LPS O-acetylase OafA/YrhL
LLYSLALTGETWRKFFSLRWLTAIGGMCYSIYLLHYNIIPVIGNYTIRFSPFHSYPLAFVWHSVILIPIILFFSTIFYVLIERPCMDKDWPSKCYQKAKSLFIPQKIDLKSVSIDT